MAVQPPQRFELDDLAHVEREARTIYAPGATPGDVLVVQSDHSLVAAPGGGSMPGAAQWFGPFPVTALDFQPSFQKILGPAAPYAGRLLVAGSVIVTEDWNDTAVTCGLDLYVGDPANALYQLDGFVNVDLKAIGNLAIPDTQGNISGAGSIVVGAGFVPGTSTALQNPILIGSGPLNQIFAYFGNGNNDGTTGAADFYLCFTTPVAP